MDFMTILSNILGELFAPTTAAYALAAIGLNIHFGMSGLMNMGQAGFMLLGAYGFAITQMNGCDLFTSVLTALVFAAIYGILLGIPTLIAAAIALVTIVSVTVFLYCTRLGRATRAVSDNAALAAASGINVDSVVRIVWILSCGLAALSGVLIGIHLNGIAWNTGVTLLMLMFAAVTLGGLGTANGALVGALIVGIVADMSTLVIPSDMRYASALAILILVLLIRPQGIFGKQKRVG